MIDRRTLLGALVGFALAKAPLARAQAKPAAPKPVAPRPDAALANALEKSPYVYISPLLADGAESTCHGEVWFGFLDGEVVIITSAKSWKARSIDRGFKRARIWVGDFGRWKQVVGRNERFREAPKYTARAEKFSDAAVVDELLALYEKKYPEEIANWRGPMREGVKDGSRVLIRYTPEPDAGRAGADRT